MEEEGVEIEFVCVPLSVDLCHYVLVVVVPMGMFMSTFNCHFKLV